MVGWVGVVSYHMRSLLDVIELVLFCAFVCRVRYFDAQIQESLVYKQGGFDLLASLGKCN